MPAAMETAMMDAAEGMVTAGVITTTATVTAKAGMAMATATIGIDLAIWCDQQEDRGLSVALLRAYLEALEIFSPPTGHPEYGDIMGHQGNGCGEGADSYGDGGWVVGIDGYDYNYSARSGSGYSHGNDGLVSGKGSGEGTNGFSNGNGNGSNDSEYDTKLL
jgi:hypothetical protein